MFDEDTYLVDKFQCGDITAFDELVLKYQNKVYDIVYCHTRNIEDAYDLTQEIFLKVFKSLGRFRQESSFYTWLYKITMNACIDYGRQSSHFHTVSIEDLGYSSDSFEYNEEDMTRSPAKAVELQELKHQIAVAIDQLPPKQKAVFVMKRYQGLSLEEIANTLGRSVGTIKAHLSHATAKLSKLLKPYLENSE